MLFLGRKTNQFDTENSLSAVKIAEDEERRGKGVPRAKK